MLHPLARPVELDEPAVVHDAVDERGGELVVAEHDAPFGELDVGGDHRAPLLVAIAQHLEQQPRPLPVERNVAELVDDDEPRPRDVLQQGLQAALPARLRQHEHQLGGGEEPRLLSRLRARHPHGDGEVGLAAAGLAAEDEVLRTFDEPQRPQVVDPVALRQGHLGEVVALERLHLRELRLPDQALSLPPVAQLQLRGDRPAHGGGLAGGGRRKEPVDGAVREVHRPHERPDRGRVVLLDVRHGYAPFPPKTTSYSARSMGSS